MLDLGRFLYTSAQRCSSAFSASPEAIFVNPYERGGYARRSSSPQIGDARGPAPLRRAANSRRALSSDRVNVPDRWPD
jgi:hypothetical protein